MTSEFTAQHSVPLLQVAKFKEGIIKMYSILKELGEIIPDQIDYAIVIEENIHAKTQIKNYSETNLLALPLMTDKHKLAAMQFMNHGISSGFFANQILVPILIFRMMRMSIEFGLCKLSALALSLYGGWVRMYC